MNEKVENLILEHLRMMRAAMKVRLDRVERRLDITDE
jgi:hypothetical protein